MKRTKRLTKKQRKASLKTQRELLAQNAQPHKETHSHSMWCVDAYLQSKDIKKQSRAQLRDDKRRSKTERVKTARQVMKARKAAGWQKHQEKQATHAL